MINEKLTFTYYLYKIAQYRVPVLNTPEFVDVSRNRLFGGEGEDSKGEVLSSLRNMLNVRVPLSKPSTTANQIAHLYPLPHMCR